MRVLRYNGKANRQISAPGLNIDHLTHGQEVTVMNDRTAQELLNMNHTAKLKGQGEFGPPDMDAENPYYAEMWEDITPKSMRPPEKKKPKKSTTKTTDTDKAVAEAAASAEASQSQ